MADLDFDLTPNFQEIGRRKIEQIDCSHQNWHAPPQEPPTRLAADDFVVCAEVDNGAEIDGAAELCCGMQSRRQIRYFDEAAVDGQAPEAFRDADQLEAICDTCRIISGGIASAIRFRNTAVPSTRGIRFSSSRCRKRSGGSVIVTSLRSMASMLKCHVVITMNTIAPKASGIQSRPLRRGSQARLVRPANMRGPPRDSISFRRMTRVTAPLGTVSPIIADSRLSTRAGIV